MARSSGSCYLDVAFMSEEDKRELCKQIEGIDSYWIQDLYTEGMLAIDMYESGFSWPSHEDILYTYANFVLNKYPEAKGWGRTSFDWLCCEGSDRFNFEFENGIFNVRHEILPLDYPSWCPECDADLEFDIADVTENNYLDYIVKCPNCGHEINLSEEYNIEIDNFTITKEEEAQND